VFFFFLIPISMKGTLFTLCCFLAFAFSKLQVSILSDESVTLQNSQFRPVVLWHGMGDTCCFNFSMGFIKSLIQQYLPNTYVYSVEIGNSIEEDQMNGFFMNVNDQIEMMCNQLPLVPELANGFNAVGFSQGSQFLRAYVERCNNPPVHNLISIGGQHQGVYGFPRCPGANETICEWVRELLNEGAYISWIQDFLVQAEYWHDPFNEQEYLDSCIFLPDINNAGSVKNESYKENFMSLNKLALVRFTLDSFVQPIDSEWFSWYAPNNDKVVVPYNETDLYVQDWIGLRYLDENGRVDFLSVVGDHLRFTEQWFIDTVIANYLYNTL